MKHLDEKERESEVRRQAFEPPFGSNKVQLSVREWIVAGALVVGICLFIPWIWQRIEPFEPGPDYRMSYELSNDYWLYSRYCGLASSQDKVLVIGDSVVWGEYVAPEDTLTHHLNALTNSGRFVNLGVDGIHPAAMSGLIAYYGRAIRGRTVILHFNPLWMSSKRHDLQTEREFQFNHPKLVPQLSPWIPCYRESYANRIGIVIERYLPFRAWTNHLAIMYFENTDIATWARENPYSNPLARITLELPEPNPELRHKPVPWTETVGSPVDFEWVEPASSIQWRSFQQAVRTLRARDNGVFVVLGPFNEYMIKEQQIEPYNAIKQGIDVWLDEQRIPHYAPAKLPSDLYADASHPLGKGYELIAEQILQDDSFRRFLDGEKRQASAKNHDRPLSAAPPHEG
jgi:hypothetical protein